MPIEKPILDMVVNSVISIMHMTLTLQLVVKISTIVDPYLAMIDPTVDSVIYDSRLD